MESYAISKDGKTVTLKKYIGAGPLVMSMTVRSVFLKKIAAEIDKMNKANATEPDVRK